jgi:hypothetical protein
LFHEIAALYKHSETLKQVNDDLLDEININVNNDDVIREKLDRIRRVDELKNRNYEEVAKSGYRVQRSPVRWR